MAPDIVRGRVPAARLLIVLGNSWFALGPAAVLAARAGRRPATRVRRARAGAARAQAVADFAAPARIRERLRGELSLRELAAEMRTGLLIDVAL